MTVPIKWARFKDAVLDDHLRELYAYLGQFVGTSVNDTDPFYYTISYDGSGRVSTITYYSDTSKSTPLVAYTYTYTASGLMDKETQTIYQNGIAVSIMKTQITYNANNTVNYVTKQVA